MTPGGQNAEEQFSENLIIKILKSGGGNEPREMIVASTKVSEATYYKWKTEYVGVEAANILRLRELEEDHRSKQMYAELYFGPLHLEGCAHKSCKAGSQGR